MNMTAQEKIDHLQSILDHTVNTAAMCPVLGMDYEDCQKDIEALTAAISALEVQIPRVLTLEEIESAMKELTHAKRLRAVWVETRAGHPPVYPSGIVDIADDAIFAHENYWAREEYGITYRFWTQYPTGEQMAAEPWANEGREGASG